MNKLLLKSLLLMLLFCLVPMLCSADLIILSGKTKGSGFENIAIGNAGWTGGFGKGADSMFMILDVTSDYATNGDLGDYTSTVNEAYVIAYSTEFYEVFQIFNLAVVVDPDAGQIGLFSPDLFNDNDVDLNIKLFAVGKGSLVDVGTASPIPFGKSMKGMILNNSDAEIFAETLTLKFSKDSIDANQELLGDITQTVTELVAMLQGKGLQPPQPQ